jgi:predicted PurR-regulated permease PerM
MTINQKMPLPSSVFTPRVNAPLDVAVAATPRNWATLLILLLVTVVLFALTPFLPGLVGAVALYVIVRSPYEWLARHMRSWIAATIAVIAALLLIIGPLGWLVSVVIERAPGAVRGALASPLLSRVGEIRFGSVDLSAELSKMSDTIISTMSSQVGRFVGSATSILINLTLAFFGLYYLLGASSRTWEFVRQYVPFSARTADALRDRFIGATQATVLGTGVISIAQGTLVGLGFWITGLPEPLFWGSVSMVAAIIPAIGSTIVWLPGVLVLASQHRYGAAVTLFVFGFGLAGNVDSLIRPFVYRRLSETHPLITFVGVLAGVRYLGLLGVLLGPLAIVYVFELLRFYREEYTSA